MVSFQSVVILVLTIAICYNDAKPQNLGIIGGHNVTIERFPFMVSVRVLNGSFHYCGGSIIHPSFILTAAHCVLPNQTFTVVVGSSKLNKDGSPYNVSKIIPHKEFNPGTKQNDICLMKLEKPLEFGRHVKMVTLPEPKLHVKKGTMLSAIGWGYTSPDGEVSNNLLEVLVPSITLKACRRAYAALFISIYKTMMCAGGNGRDTCQGDSGGPLTLDGVQVGVTSFGGKCGENPGIFTKVTSFLDWIKDNMANNN